MKKRLLILFTTLAMAPGFSVFAQSSVCSYSTCSPLIPFSNTDFLQIYKAAVSQGTGAACNYSTCIPQIPFTNTDLMQIYGALVSNLGSGGGSGGVDTTAWHVTGNSISTNTNFIGPTSNRSLLLKSNNSTRVKIDSTGLFTFGTGPALTNSISSFAFYNNAGGRVDITGSYGLPSIHMGQTNASMTNNNFSFLDTGTSLLINSDTDSGSVVIQGGNNFAFLTIRGLQTSVGNPGFSYATAARTNLPGTANLPDISYAPGITRYLGGVVIPTQTSDFSFSPTFQATTASTITNAYTHYRLMPTAGSGMTISNRWGYGTNGSIHAENSALIGTTARTPTANLDVTGTAGITSTLTMGGILRLRAGTATAGTAPMLWTSGTLLTTPIAGATEFLTDKWYGTITTGAARKEITLNDVALTSGRVPFATTNGRLTDLAAFTYATNRLSPTYITLAAGAAAAGSAPVVLTTGTSLTTPIAGAIEYTTPQLFFTNGSALRQEIPQIQQSRVSSVFNATSNTTLANITGLTANVAAGRTYKLRAVLYTTSDVGAGVKFAIGGTATATSIIYEGLAANAGTFTQTRAAALGTAVCAVTAVTAAYVIIEGTITVNAAGTITVQFAQNVSSGVSSTVAVGSNFQIQEIL